MEWNIFNNIVNILNISRRYIAFVADQYAIKHLPYRTYQRLIVSYEYWWFTTIHQENILFHIKSTTWYVFV